VSLEGVLDIDLGAIAANWRALDAMSAPEVETAAVVKADAYGLGAARVAPVLARAGAQTFFVAQSSEGAAIRQILGPGPAIYILSGFPLVPGEEADRYAAHALRPVLNGPEQVAAWIASGAAAGGERPAALQIDTGMNRLGLEADELAALEWPPGIDLVMSHMATADTADGPMNATQLAEFERMTLAAGPRRSLAATGGTRMGAEFHFDMTRPGIGLFGGLPFAEARPVVTLHLPILQVRQVAPGEVVGYGETWRATRASRIATLSGGYADGLHRILSNAGTAFVKGRPAPMVGRVSMDLIGIDVTNCPAAEAGALAEIIGPHQALDTLAAAAQTIGYEILTSLGSRYNRRYHGG